MLFVTALTFLVLTAPVAVAHLVHTLITEESVHIQGTYVMTLFAIADLLAFAQHASQFYVCFVCSFCFRQALRRQLVRLALRIDRLLPSYTSLAPLSLLGFAGRSESMRRSREPPAPYFQWHIQPEQQRLLPNQNRLGLHVEESAFNKHSRISKRTSTTAAGAAAQLKQELTQKKRTNHIERVLPPCEKHEFLWAGPSLLVCRRCRTFRLVHHPTCLHMSEQRRLSCSCLTRESKPPSQSQALPPASGSVRRAEKTTQKNTIKIVMSLSKEPSVLYNGT